jgi:hypothetical protein
MAALIGFMRRHSRRLITPDHNNHLPTPATWRLRLLELRRCPLRPLPACHWLRRPLLLWELLPWLQHEGLQSLLASP